MTTGISNTDIQSIISVFKKHPEIEEAVLFGSRAKGNFQNGSDIDIAIKGKEVSHSIVVDVSVELNEDTLMPYHFDILNFHTVSNIDLSEHIARIGIPLYRKKE